MCSFIYGAFLNYGSVMVVVLASSPVDRWFKVTSGQGYEIGICTFLAKHASLRTKNKNLLAWNRDNVSAWRDTFTSFFSNNGHPRFSFFIWKRDHQRTITPVQQFPRRKFA